MRKVGGILVLAMTLSCGSDLWAATQHRKYKTQIIEERPVTTYYRTREDSTERFARVVTAPVRVVGWVATAPFRWVAPKTFGGTDALMLERDDSVRRAPRYTSARRYERNRYVARPIQSRRVAVQRRDTPRFVEVAAVPVRTAGWVATAPFRWVAPRTFGETDALLPRETLRRGT